MKTYEERNKDLLERRYVHFRLHALEAWALFEKTGEEVYKKISMGEQRSAGIILSIWTELGYDEYELLRKVKEER